MSAALDDDADAQLWAEYEQLPADPSPVRSMNHGGPGVCLMCYPNGMSLDIRKPAVQPVQQQELQL